MDRLAEIFLDKLAGRWHNKNISRNTLVMEMGIDIQIDQFTPCLVERTSRRVVDTLFDIASVQELQGLRKKGWLFNWRDKSLKKSEIYKLTVVGASDIQGLVALEYDHSNLAVHLSLAESAPHNRGEQKQYEGVGGHLFAIAVKKSFEAGYGGFIYFEAKNMELVRHYSEKFGAFLIGRPHEFSMIIDDMPAAQLLKSYTLKEDLE